MDDAGLIAGGDALQGRIRLGVMAHLASTDVADFKVLIERLQCTDGNLSFHLRKLEEAGLVAVEKTFVRRKPMTRVRMTASGRRAMIDCLDAMDREVQRDRKTLGPSFLERKHNE
jgi:DNA-binding MarR family transcriptional regulator